MYKNKVVTLQNESNLEMSNKISVITVVFNDVTHIRATMECFFSQTWEDKEYIVIDGGSTDGTAEIIKEYADRLAYWCSEKDGGIYDAMNKGIMHATGDWINILNCGDVFSSNYALEQVIKKAKDIDNIDIIYGNSIENTITNLQSKKALNNVSQMEYRPIYRHGSSLIRASIQKEHLFDLSKSKDLKYSLDWFLIHTLYKKGYKFEKVDVEIQTYLLDGISNNIYKSIWYNYKITTAYGFSIKKVVILAKSYLSVLTKNSIVTKCMRAFVLEYVVNDILPHIPIWSIRKFLLKRIGTQIGKKSFVMKKNYITSANRLTIGDYTHINRNCTLDARGYITIGNNTSISHSVNIMTGSHDISSPNFASYYLPIIIEDNVWIGINATILSGIRIGKGAVVCAGAVVTKDVPSYSIVAGIPAKIIRKRIKNLNYHCIWDMPFT